LVVGVPRIRGQGGAHPLRNTDPETLRLARRHIFSATTRRRSADWDHYDRITAADKRVAMVLRPDHIYRSALTRMREALTK
jgi:hypothetical protein